MFERVAVSGVVLFVLALVSCGNGGTPDAAEVYADAGEAMAALTSYHVAVEGQDDGDGGPSGTQIDFMPPDSFEATFTFDEDGEVLEFSVIGIGDDFYQQLTSISSDWFTIPEEERADFGGLGAFATALTTEISDLSHVGEEDVDGVATYHLEGSLAREVMRLVETEGPLPESTTVELWVGEEDSLVRRYVLSPSEPDEVTTLTLSRFDDETISIEAPADPRPADEIEELFEESEGDFSTPEELEEAIAELPAEQQECLRRVWGDAVYEELAGGERMFTEAEETAGGEECFTD